MRTIPHALLILTAVLTAVLANPSAVAQPTPAAKATTQDSDAAKKNALRAQAFKAKQNREFSKAGDLFLKLQKLDPTDPEPYLLAGECLEKSKRYNDALDVLEAGRKRFPAELRFSVGIARSYNLKGHDVLNTSGKFDNFVLFTLQDCVREAEGVLQKHPDNRDMRLILAQTLYTLRELDKCKTNSEELVKRFPDHPGGYILLGDLAYQEYVGLVQASRQQGADTSKEAMQKIAAARDLAKERYTKALSLDRNRVVAHRKLGDVHAWNGDRMGALAKYADALRLDPTTGVSHTWIKANFGADKRYAFYTKAAEAHLKLPTPDKKKAALLTWHAAIARYDERKWQEAEDLFLACVTANQDYVNSYYWAMWSAIQGDAKGRAAGHCASFATVAPIAFADVIRQIEPKTSRDSTIQQLDQFALEAYQRRRLAAARDISHVLAAVLDTADKWNNYAFLCRETRIYKESLAAYENALQVEPDDAQLLNDAAVILDYHLGTADQVRRAERVHKRLMKTRRMIAYESPALDAKSLQEQAKANLRRAAEMYKEAAKLADKALRAGKVKKEDRERIRTARRDARNNLRKLRERLK
ncbi:MAG: tetratricopeptide repeat protein [Planctomycetota bacterium]|jgi:tetratricopeptide (TPR) repeat protein